MQIKARVQAHHFVNDKQVTVQLQGVETGSGWSAQGPASLEEAADIPVGAIVMLDIVTAE
jgi:hypothetical protein